MRRLLLMPGFLAVVILINLPSTPAFADDTLRSQAVVNLTFDEENGPAADSATAGQHKDDGQLANGAQRVSSPFWGQSAKRAVLLDAGRQQYVAVPDSADVDRPDAVTFGLFFLNLHPLDDVAYRGVVAKRVNDPGAPITNYGINFHAKNDAFQVYVHHGSGFRAVVYSVKDAVGSRRLNYLTASFEVADAPEPDADADADDLRIRFSLNGQIQKPKSVANGSVIGDDAWLLDVDPQGLLNDTPLTLGASNAAAEHASCLVDEFSLFARALSPEEVAKLFLEVAGENAADLAREELQPKPTGPAAPRIAALSLHGIQIGKTTRLVIRGQNLAGGRVVLPVTELAQQVADGSNGGQLLVDLTPPADAAAGFYPLRVQTAAGLSNTVVVAVDHLPQFPAIGTSSETPAVLPAAFSGDVSGAAQPRVYFEGKQGQRIVADLEAKRLGARFDPVLEIKTERGTPLEIDWGKVYLRRDPRAEVTLPADGTYFVEVHDLAYKAPGRNPFRLKLGDLKLVDAFFPPAVSAVSTAQLTPIGVGLPDATVSAHADVSAIRTSMLPKLPADWGPLGPAPAVRVSPVGVEILEAEQSDQSLQQIDATFSGPKHVPIFINGRIAQPAEQDRYELAVTTGQTLSLALQGRSIDSPLDAKVAVSFQGRAQIVKEDVPNSRDPVFNYLVPANVKKVVVSVEDLYGRGGAHYVYRLRIVPAGQPNFSLDCNTPELLLPRTGTAVAELQLTRRGYNGPVALRLEGDDGLTISPEQIPAGGGNRKVFLTLTRTGGEASDAYRSLRIVGETVGLDPPIRRAATVAVGDGSIAVPGHRDVLPMAIGEPADVGVRVAGVPPALFKGVDFDLPLGFQWNATPTTGAVRLTLLSTEAVRPVDPNDAKKGNKPIVQAAADQAVTTGSADGALRVTVPLDVAEPQIEFVVRAELVPHAYSGRVQGTAYSQPFGLAVKDAAAVDLDAQSFNLTAGSENKLRGTVKRTPGFDRPLQIALAGLPEGYAAAPITVPPDASEFEIPVTAPDEKEPRNLDKITLQVTVPGGDPVLPDQTIQLKVAPAAKVQDG